MTGSAAVRRGLVSPPIALLGLGLAACATAPRPRDATTEATQPSLRAGEGMVVVSVVTNDPASTPEPLASAEFALRGPHGSLTWLASAPDNALDRSTDFANEQGRLYALVLPAGTYRINDWRIHVPPYVELAPPTPPAPLTFAVTSQRTRYLGELHMGFVTRHKATSLPMLETGQVTVRDRHDRDLALLAARWPGLDPGTIDVQPLGAVAPAVPAAPSRPTTAAPPAASPDGNPPGFSSRPYKPPMPIP